MLGAVERPPETFEDEHALELVRERARARIRSRAALALSFVAHALALSLLFGSRPVAPPTSRDPAQAGVAARFERVLLEAERPARASARRAQLVAEARAQRAEGKLALGSFLLRANAIDAEEEGAPLDLTAAQAAYDARRTALADALARLPPERAVAEVFGDLAYSGTPGGRVADALRDKRGSCEPLAQLVAAALYDVGLGGESGLRFWGGASAGITHLAPVLLAGAPARPRDLDLMTQAPAAAGGARFAAADLVEVYARAHGLSGAPVASLRAAPGARPPASRARPRGEGLYALDAVPRTRTLEGGYPANDDSFAGGLPLYAERAFAPARAAGTPGQAGGASAPEPPREPPSCPFFVHMAWLDPPHATVFDDALELDVELVRQPARPELERLASIIQSVQASERPEGLAPRLIDHACMAALFDHAGVVFSLAGQPDVSRRAASSARRERELGKQALAELAALPESERIKAGDEIDEISVGRIWILLFLDGGEVPVLDRAENPASPFDRILPLTAMIVLPRTRGRALALAETLPVERQLDVMHELVHAHDNARPWAASYRLELAPGDPLREAEFARTYGVFYALSWRLWDATRAPEETVESLLAEAEAAHLARARVQALVTYYIKQYFLLLHLRVHGIELVERADRAARRRGFDGLAAVADDSFLSPAERKLFEHAASAR